MDIFHNTDRPYQKIPMADDYSESFEAYHIAIDESARNGLSMNFGVDHMEGKDSPYQHL